MGQLSRPFDDADLHAFVDGQISLEHRAAFVEALAADPDAEARVESWKRQNDALNATFGAILLEPVPVRLMPTNLAKEKRPAMAPAPRPSPARGMIVPMARAPIPAKTPRALVIGIAMTAFAAGIAATYGALATGPSPSAGSYAAEVAPPADAGALARRAGEAHQTYATDLSRPVEITASDEPQLLTWVQHRLAMPVRIPDLRSQGWNLLGGRVLPGDLGPAAFLVYGNGLERLGLYMARTEAPQSAELALFDPASGRPTVAYWVDAPVGYALTTGRSAGWFSRNAPALYQSVRAQVRGNASGF